MNRFGSIGEINVKVEVELMRVMYYYNFVSLRIGKILFSKR